MAKTVSRTSNSAKKSAKSSATTKRTATTRRKTSSKKNSNKQQTSFNSPFLFYGIIVVLIIGVGSLLLYASFVFPKTLYTQIKNDIISIYNPVIYEDDNPKMPAVFKLDHIPEQKTQVRLVQIVKEHYGLDVTFNKIADYDDKGINQIIFAKNGSEYNSVRDIYIYWDKSGTIVSDNNAYSDIKYSKNTESKTLRSDENNTFKSYNSNKSGNERDTYLNNSVVSNKNSNSYSNASNKPNRNESNKHLENVAGRNNSKQYIKPENKSENKSAAKDAVLKEKNEIKTFEQRQKSISSVKTETSKDTIKEQIRPKPVAPVRRIEQPHSAKITIIIDDVGYAYEATDKFLSIGVPMTFAIIPETPRAAKYYKTIVENNYEAIIHIPMEPQKGPSFVESNALLTSMSDVEISTNVQRFFMEMPACIGANNHMGSKAVADGHLMNVLIRSLAERNKVWVDSMTNADTLSREFTSIYGMPDLHRDVFLDNQKDRASLRKAMELLISDAKKKGRAIGIGHAQTDLLPDVILEYYNRRDELGIEFVGLR